MIQLILLVKPLISEVPIQRSEAGLTKPTLKKIVVDLLADAGVFRLFSEELPPLVKELYTDFILNLHRIHRYAQRRHKLPFTTDYLSQSTTHPKDI